MALPCLQELMLRTLKLVGSGATQSTVSSTSRGVMVGICCQAWHVCAVQCVPQGMQRSAVFNMPMAILVAKSWNKYLELPTKYKAVCLGLTVQEGV